MISVSRVCVYALLVPVVGLLAAILLHPSQILRAQDEADGWAPPQRLNSACCAFRPVPMVDPWGQMHVFWAEQDGSIFYARLEDEGWSLPVDILVDPAQGEIWSLDAAVGADGYLHVVWASGAGGPLHYSRAQVSEANDARSWQEPAVVAERAMGCTVDVDSSGLVHLIYAPFQEGQSAVHVTTRDGTSWSNPDQIPSELGTRWTGGEMQLAIDQDDTLHLAWGSTAFPEGFPPNAVYYQRSTDGGRTWSEPYDPDPQPPDIDGKRDSAFKNNKLNVAVGPSGDVHLTWHRYTGKRWHQWSEDGGQTWSTSEPLFPDMGAAFNGYVDMAFDSSGRMHTVATRNSVWYQSWEQESGQPPAELVDPADPDWHHQRVAVFEGNQVYLFYADVNETGIIWFTSKLVDAPQLVPAPQPVEPEATSIPSQVEMAVTPTVLPAKTPSPTSIPPTVPEPLPMASPLSGQSPILVGVVPAALLIAIVLAVRWSFRRR